MRFKPSVLNSINENYILLKICILGQNRKKINSTKQLKKKILTVAVCYRNISGYQYSVQRSKIKDFVDLTTIL